MQEAKFWYSWSDSLQRWGFQDIACFLLSSSGPLKLFLAQLALVVQPLFLSNISKDEFSALIELLEDSQECHRFVCFLSEEGLH
jgi:hypothetical protein